MLAALRFVDDNHLLLGIRDGIAKFDYKTGQINYLSKIIHDENSRFNDGAVDLKGRFLIGSMNYEPTMESGILYSHSSDGLTQVLLPKVGISNGICWNHDSTKMFYVDSMTNSIQVFDYLLEDGSISNAKVLIKFSMSDGTPDGLTIDSSGRLWVAMWGGGQVICLDQKGKILFHIKLPVNLVTSVAFGGEGLTDLYITTASYMLSDVQLKNEPLAGSLFRITTDIPGSIENRFT